MNYFIQTTSHEWKMDGSLLCACSLALCFIIMGVFVEYAKKISSLFDFR